MSLQEFKNKYLGKQVEYHSFGAGALNQCVDLVNQYIKEVLNLTPVIGTNAKDFPQRFNQDEFVWTPNDPTAIPKPGDIVVWNGNVGGGAGHIAIVLSAGLNAFQSLDQNWSITERVTLETHNYNNVTGWLSPKGGIIEDEVTPVDDWKKTQFDKILIEAHKRSITPDDKSENWNNDRLVIRLFDHIDTQEETIDDLEQEVRVLGEKHVEDQEHISQLEIELEACENTECPELPFTPEDPSEGTTEPQKSPLVAFLNKILHWFR